MGCDGYIVDPSKPIFISIKCHDCGGAVYPDVPERGHEGCFTTMDDKLKVDLEIDNYEPRQAKIALKMNVRLLERASGLKAESQAKKNLRGHTSQIKKEN